MLLEKDVKRLSLYENSLKNRSKWKLQLKYFITIKYLSVIILFMCFRYLQTKPKLLRRSQALLS